MSEVEKQFFEIFEIERKPVYSGSRLYNPVLIGYEYPQISDSILLELICLTGNTGYFLINNEGDPIDVEGLKNSVLHSLTIYSKFHKDLKHKVQTIFKGN